MFLRIYTILVHSIIKCTLLMMGICFALTGCLHASLSERYHVDDPVAEAVRSADHRGKLFDNGRWHELVTLLEAEHKAAEQAGDSVRLALVLNELAEIHTFYSPSIDEADAASLQLRQVMSKIDATRWGTKVPYCGLPTTIVNRRRLYVCGHPDYIRTFHNVSREEVVASIARRKAQREWFARDSVTPEQRPRLELTAQGYESALQEMHQDPVTEARYLAQASFARLLLEDWTWGLKHYEDFRIALETVKSRGLNPSRDEPPIVSQDELSRMLWAAAKGYRIQGMRERSEDCLNELAALLESTRLTTRSQAKRIQYFKGLQLTYEELIRLALLRNDALTALKHSESAKSRSLLELLLSEQHDHTPNTAHTRPSISPQILQTMDDGTTNLSSMDLRGGRKMESSSPDDALNRDAILSQAREPAHTGHENGVITIAFHVMDDRVVRWIICGKTIRAATIELTRAELSKLIDDARSDMLTGGLSSAALDTLSLRLLGDLPELQSVETAKDELLIIPDGPLHEVPFAVLRVGQRFLGLERPYTLMPSLQLTEVLLRREKSVTGKIVLAGDPIAPIEGLLPLPGAAAEVASIHRMLGGEARLGSEASEYWLKRSATGARLLHLAVHGGFVPGSPQRSWLAMTAGQGQDGLITASELARLPLAPGATVVLSGCETGRIKIGKGDEMFGLRRALFVAGAGTLLTSHWPVGDQLTREFMESWYSNWQGGHASALATLMARKRNAQQDQRLRAWAAFDLTGLPDHTTRILPLADYSAGN